ncbi:hypothetical protein VKT23_018511 [Stygiomarasmius scandens]|uniref:DUF7330 domain-containing protein n=1 Tax=Marasmiellus scandens TaxID=2682957 RepID=A0ABR1IS02_9AGAR
MHTPPTSSSPLPSPELFPIPPEFVVVHDAEWSEPRSSGPSSPDIGSSSRRASSKLKFVRTTAFEFPIDSERLFVLSRGNAFGGNIQLTQCDTPSGAFGLDFGSDDMFTEKHFLESTQVNGAERVKIEIAVEYPELGSGWFDWVKVCSLRRRGREGQNGLGIFTPNDSSSKLSGYRIEIIVTFPQPRSSSGPSSSSLPVLKINNFETDTKMFSHQIDNLSTTILFRSISLRTASAPIFIESLRARRANFQTSNAPIEGTFCVSSFLNLETSNAKIRSSVLLENTDSRRFSQLNMVSSNSPILSSIILSSPSRPTGGNFAVLAKTSNSPVNITFPSAPPYHNLQLRVSTMLADADVHLPDTYEGRFDVQTNTGSADVSFLNHDNLSRSTSQKKKAAERIKRRILEYERHEAARISGWVNVSGEEEGKFRGEVQVITSMAGASLQM